MLHLIHSLSEESSKNAKQDILKKHKNDELLKKVLYYAYNPMFNYFMKDVNIPLHCNETSLELEDVFPVLDNLINRVWTGYSAKKYLNDLMMSLSFNDRTVVSLIINKDLRCGISEKSINKVWENLIPTIPYMRCSLTDKIDRINYPAIIQKKADGLFVNVVCKDGAVKFYTRNGTEFNLYCVKNDIEDIIDNSKYGDVVLHGELLVFNEDGEMSRKVGNGLINSLIKKNPTLDSLYEKIAQDISSSRRNKITSDITLKLKEYDETDNNLRLIIWDIVPYDDWLKGECDIPYGERLQKISSINYSHIMVIEGDIVNSFEEAQEFYKVQISKGFEGAILKNINTKWKNHTSPEHIKMKAERECDLRVIDFEEGAGKYIGMIGSLVCVSEDRKVRVNVGSGLSDDDRAKPFDFYKDKVIAVKFNELIDSETKETHSLFLPRFIEVREDKTIADTFDTIKSM